MRSTTELIWLEAGYALFAFKGAVGLKVEVLAKEVGINKSSFYHHFADMEVFVAHLLQFHLERSELIASKERLARNIDPELIAILVAHKTDLLFNRQLRFNAQDAAYKHTLDKSNAITGTDFVQLWMKELRLALQPAQVEALFSLALENFYLQINPQNLNTAWLSTYFAGLKKTAQHFAVPVDGSV